ncbi:MAG TPA: dipeptide epimerase [candidate division Zixibacteria bacterium]|nr:dipeptide epimerase [candidate division Zixibacteria bacterium]HEQ99883.1 dipeptide epimerase [candidate division Zixibacteria bacterium]
MHIRAELIETNLKETFRISRGESSGKKNCIVHLEDALGECCPSIYYGYSAEDCCQVINESRLEIKEALEFSRQLDYYEEMFSGRKSLLAGLDIVLHDYISRKLDLPLYQYLGIPDPQNLETSYTISIDKPENLEKRLKAAEGFKSVKLKIGSEYDKENLKILHDRTKFRIRVDANGAFALDQIMELVPIFNDYKLELVEQPLAESSPSDLKMLRKELKVPIFLDESIVEVQDVYKYLGAIDGVNIKLQRVGGIRMALKMIQAARSLGMKIMFGCMLETNIGNCATAHLGGFADFLDLDSSMLLKDDPFEGLSIDRGRIIMPAGKGIGARRKQNV